MNITVDNKSVRGEGKNLYAIVTIDENDHEDTSTELWLANDEDDLYESVKKDFIGEEDGEESDDDDFSDEEFGVSRSSKFEEDWGLQILHSFIGTVK